VTSVALGLMVIRVSLGIVFVAHGCNHIFGGGKIAGTGRWFESLGMRPGWLHAWTASLTEVGSGGLLILGLATPLACAGVIGTMLVAWITNHLRNGFFIFRPGEGYEYVMTLTLIAFGLSGLGAGQWSLDHVAGWFDPPGWTGVTVAAVAGFGGAAGLLATCWRPPKQVSPAGGPTQAVAADPGRSA
jgi:putative oxidoreductase